MSDGKPAETVHPGEFLREELEARLWDVEEFGEMIHRSPRFVRLILAGEWEITESLARELARVFGTSAQLWLGLQRAYDQSQGQPPNGSELPNG